MIYTVKEYAITFAINGKFWSEKTIIRRAKKNQLPTNHKILKVGRNYAIEVISIFLTK